MSAQMEGGVEVVREIRVREVGEVVGNERKGLELNWISEGK